MAGRHAKKSGERLDTELRIRLTPAQRKAIDAAAKKNLLESSTWARGILVREAEKVKISIASATGELLESPVQGQNHPK